MKTNPTIANLVLHRRDTERAQWLVLLTVCCAGLVMVGALTTLGGVSQPGQLYRNAQAGPVPAQVSSQAWGVNSHGRAMRLHPFGQFKIVDNKPCLPRTAPAVSHPVPFPTLVSAQPGDYCWGGSSLPDNDFGLPDQAPLWSHPNHTIANPPTSTIDRLPSAAWPEIIFHHDETTPSLRFLPDSAYVRGHVVFRTSGWLRFDPVGNEAGLSPRVYDYLCGTVKAAYASEPCIPAIEDGRLVEKTIGLLRVTFAPDAVSTAWCGSDEVQMTTPISERW